MNGDRHSVAAAPLDLRTTNRERGSAGSRTPDCGLPRSRQGLSPAPAECTGTNNSEIHSPALRSAPGSETGAARKRPADNSFHNLPFRKRPVHKTQAQSPAPPESGDRSSLVEDTDVTFRESLSSSSERAAGENRVGPAPVTPGRNPETGQSPDRCPTRLLQINYGKRLWPTFILLGCIRTILFHSVFKKN